MGVGVNGTFTATGVSGEATGQSFDITLDFGTGSVDLEKKMPSGTWMKIETAIAADYNQVYEGAAETTLRLNCTAWTANIEYRIAPGRM